MTIHLQPLVNDLVLQSLNFVYELKSQLKFARPGRPTLNSVRHIHAVAGIVMCCGQNTIPASMEFEITSINIS